MGFPNGSCGKESAFNAGNSGDTGSIPGLRISPAVGSGNPLQDSCLEKSHGQRSLVGFSPWGHKESDGTEHAHMHCCSVPSGVLLNKSMHRNR